MKLKASEFNVFVPSFFEGTTLGFNTFTGSFLSFGNEEWAQVATLFAAVESGLDITTDPLGNQLVELGMLVADDYNERAEVLLRYHKGRAATRAMALTIAPTISCNFGCTYCFQEHPARHMSEADIVGLLAYVARRLEPDTALHITWFGGEPLLAFDLITDLSAHLRAICVERRCHYGHSMITNGSLLDEKKAAWLATQGLDFIQITLDGPPAYHNQRRPLGRGRPSFDRILKNIAAAAGRIPITLRVNVDRTNVDGLGELLAILQEQGLRDSVSIYLGHVLPFTEVCSNVETTAFSREEFAAVEAHFEFLLLENGFRPRTPLPRPRTSNLCIADHVNGSVIAPDGLVFRCWNEVAMTASAANGKLTLDGEQAADSEQSANQLRWDTYDPFTHEMCRSCKVQPLCNGGCPWEAAKKPTTGTGHCVTAKFNLPDRLRLFHLGKVIEAYPWDSASPITTLNDSFDC